MALFEVENLSYHYPDEDSPALEDVNTVIQEGEFILLTGGSGSGKSSLLRAMAGLLADFHGGQMRGNIVYGGKDLRQWDRRELSREIGIVFQDPELQMLTTRVEREIAFGLENLGLAPAEMRRRVAESLSFFNLLPLRTASTQQLSGGQKQMTVLASVLAMHPQVLLLDEPTSQLDPVFAQDLLGLIHRLNVEFGMTVVLVEQRVDRCFHLADRVLFMEKSRLVTDTAPRELARHVDPRHAPFLPPVTRVFARCLPQTLPLSVKEGRDLLREHACPKTEKGQPGSAQEEAGGETVLRAQRVSFAYPGQDEFTLKGVDLSVQAGGISALLGDTGAGKSTLLKTLIGVVKPQKGGVYLGGESVASWTVQRIAQDVGYLSQNPNDYLFHDTVEEEVHFGCRIRGSENERWPQRLMGMLSLEEMAQINPRDLSGGERQRVALAAVLATNPAVLLLDEPTRGLDNLLKQRLGDILAELSRQGKAILVVTHDVEFAAELASRVLIMADGEIIADGSREEILTESLHYAPQVNRLFRGYVPGVVTINQATALLQEWLGKGEAG